VLAKCVEIVSKFEAESSLLEKWDIVDEIARVIIPLIEFEDAVEMLWESGDEYEAMSQGVELQALGVDWQMIVNTVVPIIVAILRALTSSQQDD
jgi:SNF family Na+-dependent transporter